MKHIYETYIMVDFDDGEQNQSSVNLIQDVYVVAYIPEGYELVDEFVSLLSVSYRWQNDDNNILMFEQVVLDNAKFIVDAENGETISVQGCEYTVYVRAIDSYNIYIWNDGKYSFKLQAPNVVDHKSIVTIITSISKK